VSRLRIVAAAESSFIRQAVAKVLEGEPTIEVVGLARSGEELLQRLEQWRPDAVILDLSLPGMGGLLTLDALLARRRLPVIVLSSHSRQDAPRAIEALLRGAMDFIDKQQYSLLDFEALRAVLVDKLHQITAADQPAIAPAVRAEGELGVRAEGELDEGPAGTTALEAAESIAAEAPGATAAGPGSIELLAIGASTGGPPAIERILVDLGDALTVPVAIVQHMPPAFTRSFADRLDAKLPLRVREAAHHEPLRPGVVYIAPGGLHFHVESAPDGLRAAVSAELDWAPYRPSVDVLFTSAAAATGGRLVAVLLTGMGLDGAAAMTELGRAGVHTIAQDRGSSIIFGMPGAAIAAGGVREVLSLPWIGPRLRQLLGAPAPGCRAL
jgi:two-component system chemotaxis response regulator CheB